METCHGNFLYGWSSLQVVWWMSEALLGALAPHSSLALQCLLRPPGLHAHPRLRGHHLLEGRCPHHGTVPQGSAWDTASLTGGCWHGRCSHLRFHVHIFLEKLWLSGWDACLSSHSTLLIPLSCPFRSSPVHDYVVHCRWQTGLQMHGGRCAGCLGSIPFARSAAKCQECDTTAHIKCSQELPSTCGLPMQFAEHLSKGRPAHSPEKRPSSWADSPNVLQGWLKMPR